MKIYIKRIGLAIVLLIVTAFAGVYIWSAAILDKTYSAPLSKVDIPTDTASVKEGARLAHIAHCGDCHGQYYTGDSVFQINNVAEFIAPNITKIIPTYSNEELERLLRFGVKKDGRSVYVMPAFMYHQLKQKSVADIIAYLRTLHSLPTNTTVPVKTTYTFLGRLQLIEGKFIPIATMITSNEPQLYIHYDTSQVSFGKYLVMTTCTACHGQDLKGEEGFSPNLIIAAAYNKEEFLKLLRTGEALGDRNVGVMSHVAKNYLSYLNNKEINSIYAYLKTKPTN